MKAITKKTQGTAYIKNVCYFHINFSIIFIFWIKFFVLFSITVDKSQLYTMHKSKLQKQINTTLQFLINCYSNQVQLFNINIQ